MALKLRLRSKRVTDPLDERVKDRIVGRDRPVVEHSSSGSEHSGECDDNDSSSSSSSHSTDSTDLPYSLSFLLRCFDEEHEKDDPVAMNDEEVDGISRVKENESESENENESDSDSDLVEAKLEEINSALRSLEVDRFRNVLLANVLKAMEVFRCLSPSIQIEFTNRNVMRFLQKLGYNAAICKTKWNSCGGLTAGNHEFIDVVRSGNNIRYFIDLNFAGEFQIARQTTQFQRFSQNLPIVFVGRSADLKVIVKLMCDEIRRSVKSTGLLLPPWRKNRFMQNKWFGPYRRTTNSFPANNTSSVQVEEKESSGVKCSMIGFSIDSGGGFKAQVQV